MSDILFQKKTWRVHDEITSEALNRVENAVAAAVAQVNANTATVAENRGLIDQMANESGKADAFAEQLKNLESEVAAAKLASSGNAKSISDLAQEHATTLAAAEAAKAAGEAAQAAANKLSGDCGTAVATAEGADAQAKQAIQTAGDAMQEAQNATAAAQQATQSAQECQVDITTKVNQLTGIVDTATGAATAADGSAKQAAQYASDAQAASRHVDAESNRVMNNADAVMSAMKWCETHEANAKAAAAQAEAAASKLDSAQAIVDDLNATKDEIDSKLAVLDETLGDAAALKSAMDDAKSASDAATAKAEEVAGNLSSIQQTLNTQNASLEDAKAKAEAASKAAADASAAAGGVANKVTTLEQTQQGQSSTISELVEDVHGLEADVEDLKTADQETTEEFGKIKEELLKAAEDTKAVDDKATANASAIESLQAEDTRLNGAIAAVTKTVDDLSGTVTANANASSKAVADLTATVSANADAASKATADLGKVVSQQGENLNAEITALKKADEDSAAELAEVKADMVKLAKALEALSNKKDPEIIVLKSEIKDLKMEVRLLKLGETEEVNITASEATVSKPAENVVITGGTVSSTKSVTGKTLTVSELSVEGAKATLRGNEDLMVTDLVVSGNTTKTAIGNTPLTLTSDGPISLSNSVIGSKCYNGVEAGLTKDTLPASVTFDGVTVQETTNNAFNVFGLQDGGEVLITNCTVNKCSNFLRLSNKANTSWTVNVVNCDINNYDDAEGTTWDGLVCCQPYSEDKSVDLAAQNQFAPDKIKINFINCRINGQPLLPEGDPETYLGTATTGQLLYVTTSNGAATEAYDAAKYPTVSFV